MIRPWRPRHRDRVVDSDDSAHPVGPGSGSGHHRHASQPWGSRHHALNSEQGNGGPADPARPLPPRFWGARETYSSRTVCSIRGDMTGMAWWWSTMTEVTTKDATLASAPKSGFSLAHSP